MKQAIWLILSLLTVIEVIPAYQADDYYYDFDDDILLYDDYREDKQPITITFSNVSSLSEIPHQHINPDHYHDQYLNITNSNVPIVPSSAFAGFYVITKLYLSQIHIKNIHPEAFKNLTGLQELHLDNNELTDLANGVFRHLDNLKVLYLNNNKLSRIGSGVFADLGNLTKLYLQNNQLSKIEDDSFKTLNNLKVLDLTGNPLETVPQDLYSLEELSLADTSLSQISVNLSKSNLTFLNLSSNHLSVVDFSLFPKGCSLFLGHNKISVLENINNVNVTNLYLENNEISTITEPFRNVKKLHLADNKLDRLEGSFFNKSDVLQTLNLCFNKISTMENDTFLGLSSLEHLNLAHNDIVKIDVGLFRDLTALTILSLSHNKVEEFQFGTFDSLKSLEELDISHNNLVDLPQYIFHSLSQLRNLNFDSNRIPSLDAHAFLLGLSNLKHLSLNHNPWNCKDLVTIEQSMDSSLERGDTFDVENYHGIACINRNEFDGNANDSKIIKILDSFKQQSFQVNDSKMLSVGIIQILISSALLLMIIFLIFVILRDKLRPSRNTSELLSQMEL